MRFPVCKLNLNTLETEVFEVDEERTYAFARRGRHIFKDTETYVARRSVQEARSAAILRKKGEIANLNRQILTLLEAQNG